MITNKHRAIWPHMDTTYDPGLLSLKRDVICYKLTNNQLMWNILSHAQV